MESELLSALIKAGPGFMIAVLCLLILYKVLMRFADVIAGNTRVLQAIAEKMENARPRDEP